MSPKKQNHACFTTISIDNSENDIFANQTKCIGKFGDVFYNGLYILGPKTFKKCLSYYVTFMVDIVK